MKRFLVIPGLLAGLAAVGVIALLLLIDVNVCTPRIEAATTDALGMELRIQRKAAQRLVPSLGFSVAGVTVASLDEKGCLKLRQGINGPFRDPTLDKVSTLRSAAAPLLGLFAEAKKFLTRGECDPFYMGTVAHPKQFRSS